MTGTAEKSRLLGGLGEIVRFVVAGSLGSTVFAGLALVFNEAGVEGTRLLDAVRWAVPYLLTSVFTHTLHRAITFRWKTPYGRSLRRTFVVYGQALVVSTLIHDQLLWRYDFHKDTAFVVSLLITGVINYLLFRHWGFRPDTEGEQR